MIEYKVIRHAFVKIKVDNIVIYVDPYDKCEGCEKADFILVTHCHFDHFDPDSVKTLLKESTKIFAPKTCESKVKNVWKNVQIVNVGEEYKLADNIWIKAVYSYNKNKYFHPRGLEVGYVISTPKGTLYIAGDTDIIEEMKDIEADIAFIPVGGTYTASIRDLIEELPKLKFKKIVAYHYDTFPEITIKEEDKRQLIEKSKELGVEIEFPY